MIRSATAWFGTAVLLVGLAGVASSQSGAGDSERWYERARTALAAGKYDDARKAYEKLRDLEPGMAEIHANLGFVYFHQREFDLAIASLRKALSLKPDLASAKTLLAISLAELGRYSEALPELEKAFRESSPLDIKRLSGLQLMRAYANVGRESDAVQVALRLNQVFPNDPEILYQTGRIYGNQAFVSMRKLAQVAPDSVWRHQAAAEAYESQGAADQALAEYRAVLAQDSSRPGVHYRIGRTLLARALHGGPAEDRQAAVGEFQHELQIDPTNANALYELGEIYRDAAQFDKAREQFEKALRYYPDFQQAQLGLGGTLLSLNLAAQAVPHLKKAAALDPSDEVPYYRLARAYKALGNAPAESKALAEFQRLHKQRESQGDSQRKFEAADVTRQSADKPDRQ